MIFKLTGRIDTSNAIIVDKQIESAIKESKTPVDALVFDCIDLQYISSAGLRIVLKYKKTISNLQVVNVSNNVYSVFEMTGFSRIINVTKALRKIDLSKCILMAQGNDGAVYRINEEEIVKVMHLANTEQMLLDEIRRSKSAFVLGIPTAISFDIADCGEGRQGAIYEALNSETLGRHIHLHPEDMQKYAVKYIDLLNIVHSIEADESEFGNMIENYSSNYAVAEQYFTPEEISVCRELLGMIPECKTLVHADPHTNNILLTGDGELMFIDMADTSLGHPIFDYAAIGLAMICNQSTDENCMSVCGMLPAEVNQFLAIALAYRFGLQNAEDVKVLMARMFSLSLLKFTMYVGHNSMGVNQMRPALVGFLRERLFPNVQQVKDDIQWFIDNL